MSNKKKLSLCDSLYSYKKSGMSSFHTPGHKNNKEFFNENFFDFDFTELPDTDSLYESKSVIFESEKLMSELFGTKKVAFSAGGCTLCIQAMLRLVCPIGGKVIFSRTIHKSAVNTISLLGINPVWILPKKDSGKYLPGRTTPEDVRKMLIKNPDSKAVYITSPDYFGVVSDIKSIASECQKFDVPLIVDNAHGSHLMFLNPELDPIKSGASMASYSAHKTLPVLTGGAWLSINDDRFTDDVKDAMSLFGSTSPSYPVMMSIDICRLWLKERGKESFLKLRKRVAKIKKDMLEKGFVLPDGPCDPTRISFCGLDVGYTGIELAMLLRKNKIEPEYSNDAYVVLIPTVMNEEKDFKRLETFIKDLEVRKRIKIEESDLSLPKAKCLPREAVFSKTKTINLKDAIGLVAAQTLCPCPPGVPIVMPGEILDRNIIKLLTNYSQNSIKVVL